MSLTEKRDLIEVKHPEISIVRQCELLDMARGSYYYKPAGESEYNLMLMRLIDEEYTKHPFLGALRITEWLCQHGHHVNHKRIERLMNKMGIEGICPKRNLSKSTEKNVKYPYLLRGLSIDHSDHVWCSDITYIPMRKGFMYLVAIMDWYSRYVLSWSISNTLDTTFCLEALDRAIAQGKPEIFNTDQGSQFTSEVFTSCLKREEIEISMDGRGRVFDNIFIERLWRSLKYEDLYIKDYETAGETMKGISNYLNYYNHERFHQSLDYQTPSSVYFSDKLGKNDNK